jgi:hypothetical protein
MWAFSAARIMEDVLSGSQEDDSQGPPDPFQFLPQASASGSRGSHSGEGGRGKGCLLILSPVPCNLYAEARVVSGAHNNTCRL